MEREKAEETSLPGLPDRPKGRPPAFPLGRPEFNKQLLEEFKSLPHEGRRAKLKQSWAEIAFILAERAKRFGMTVSTKDFGRLQQLVISAGIAVDKVIPKTETTPVGNIVLNLFGSIGADKMLSMVAPPAIDVTSTEVPECAPTAVTVPLVDDPTATASILAGPTTSTPYTPAEAPLTATTGTGTSK